MIGKRKDNSNPRNDGSRGSSRWASGHNGENEDKRTGRKAVPNVKRKGNTNRGGGKKK